MARTVAEIMAHTPQTVPADMPVNEAADCMRRADIGNVVVLSDGHVEGIVTDRDIAIRVVAEGRDLSTPVGEICSSQELVSVRPDSSLEEAVELMRRKAVRRLPVIDGDQLAGVLSIGDLALERDEKSALADISAAQPNR
ncbi:CBS domain-containing protein [Mycolicibacter terrae]|uniref:Oxidoreductase n=2 Tax=Mycolicibacter TaxID=1073531 RepID=A0A1A2YA03_MYCSD|nr:MULTISPECIES: CBS domain-containing protein [Mycolicibacter]OBH16166.1 oxidoreductase [Mycolicibacter sinensis]OBI34112.1 oxidoreductase [Mycolicibacter sinensis]RRR48519.1 CBS domain-containing protein [Mycolicibacter terrae]